MRVLAMVSALVLASVGTLAATQSAPGSVSTTKKSGDSVTMLGCVKEDRPGTYVLANAEDITSQGTGGYTGSTAAGTSGTATSGPTASADKASSSPKSYPLTIKAGTLREYLGQKVQVKGTANRAAAARGPASSTGPVSTIQKEDISSIEVETVLVVATRCDA